MQEEEAKEEEEEEQLQQQELPYSGTKDSPKHAPPMPRLSQSGNLPDTQQSELAFPFWKAQGRAAFSASTCQKTFGHTAQDLFRAEKPSETDGFSTSGFFSAMPDSLFNAALCRLDRHKTV